MASDISRRLFDKEKHYSAVQLQQGRVLLDSDWNEQVDINQYRLHTQTKDVIGHCGVPKGSGAFKVNLVGDDNLFISPGRIYIGGLLCELKSDTFYSDQPYYPNPRYLSIRTIGEDPPESDISQETQPDTSTLDLTGGSYIVYLKAWQREITYLDDPLIQEVALGEADTTTRLQTVWQVRLLKAEDGLTCNQFSSKWNELTGLSKQVMLNARTNPAADGDADPCIIQSSSGYKRLENQLYRIEIHKEGHFKWSRDNASIVTRIEEIKGNDTIKVESLGKDHVLGFAPGQWVEIINHETSLNFKPIELVKILSIDDANREIKVDGNIADTQGQKLRRWDQSTGATKDGIPITPNSWMDIEGGIQVNFTSGNYNVGDYWLIPARTTTANIEWSVDDDGIPIPQSSRGIKKHYCKLAIINVKNNRIVDVEDCRPDFPSLVDVPCIDDIRLDRKLLHGYGVVCGLKITCNRTAGDDARGYVTIEPGHAIDCEGHMIHLSTPGGEHVGVVEVARIGGYLGEGSSGKVCLAINRTPGGRAVVEVEAYEQRNFWDEVLEGTLLKDFWDNCIKNIINLFEENFGHFSAENFSGDGDEVTDNHKRITVFANMLLQITSADSGRRLFLSGTDTENSQKTEDELLRDFYNKLKGIIGGDTFCGIFDNDTPFPEYELDDGMDTIFGPPLRQHNRMIIHPNGQYAYTSGQQNRIYVYDLKQRKFIQAFKSAGTDANTLLDIALTPNGEKLYAVWHNGGNSSILEADVNDADGKLIKNFSSDIPNRFFTRLAVNSENTLIGIERGKGVFRIEKRAISFSVEERLGQEFGATDLMFVTEDRQELFVGVSSATNITQIVNVNSGMTYQLILKDERIFRADENLDDIYVYNEKLYASGAYDIKQGQEQKQQRVISCFDLEGGNLLEVSDIDIAGKIRLSSWSDERDLPSQDRKNEHILLSLNEQSKVVRMNPKNLDLDENFEIPVQLLPATVAIDKNGSMGYVHNTALNTITSIDIDRVFDPENVPDYTLAPPVDLINYSDDVFEAYRDLLSHFIQYLKDCFCDRFLINCPDCTDDDKVYLGTVEIRNGKVYHICNFTKRKYVKTFKTVDYWRSVFPTRKIMTQLFNEYICCWVLGDKRNTDKTSSNPENTPNRPPVIQ